MKGKQTGAAACIHLSSAEQEVGAGEGQRLAEGCDRRQHGASTPGSTHGREICSKSALRAGSRHTAVSPSDAGMGSPSVMAMLCPSCDTQHSSVGTTGCPQPHHPSATAWGQGGDHRQHQPRGCHWGAPRDPCSTGGWQEGNGHGWQGAAGGSSRAPAPGRLFQLETLCSS